MKLNLRYIILIFLFVTLNIYSLNIYSFAVDCKLELDIDGNYLIMTREDLVCVLENADASSMPIKLKLQANIDIRDIDEGNNITLSQLNIDLNGFTLIKAVPSCLRRSGGLISMST